MVQQKTRPPRFEGDVTEGDRGNLVPLVLRGMSAKLTGGVVIAGRFCGVGLLQMTRHPLVSLRASDHTGMQFQTVVLSLRASVYTGVAISHEGMRQYRWR